MFLPIILQTKQCNFRTYRQLQFINHFSKALVLAEKSFFTDYIEIAKRLQSAQNNIELSEKSIFSLY